MDEQSLFERWRQEGQADIRREVRLKCQWVKRIGKSRFVELL